MIPKFEPDEILGRKFGPRLEWIPTWTEFWSWGRYFGPGKWTEPYTQKSGFDTIFIHYIYILQPKNITYTKHISKCSCPEPFRVFFNKDFRSSFEYHIPISFKNNKLTVLKVAVFVKDGTTRIIGYQKTSWQYQMSFDNERTTYVHKYSSKEYVEHKESEINF